ncbi:MAG: redoxin domain-containing protein [Aphanocapsa sp. GSE-SYN-MK-11-07L]|jgi:thiol-disulfide isomerase/thioredoxin|nr:redoxin domain-containing protein [Aphanocapsa sp. GSE-SYN-MK-11-07L]
MKPILLSGLAGVSALVLGTTAVSHFSMTTTQLSLAMQPANAQTVSPLAAQLQGKPTVVKIYADWCPACQRAKPTFAALQQQYQGRVNFVVFDLSDRGTTQVAETRARQLGLSGFLDHHRTQTSTVAILNPANGQVLTQFRYNFNEQDYVNGLNRALERVKTATR